MIAHASSSSASARLESAVRVVRAGSRTYGAWLGPGVLVAVGYIDPGNWATDLAAGSRYACALVCVVVASSLLAILFQSMSARLGIATGRDLAQLSRDTWPRAAPVMWIATEVAIVATDLAEVLGAGLALHLLFRIPLTTGVIVTGADVLLLLLFEHVGMRAIERVVATLVVIVGAALVYELVLARPEPVEVARGLLPTARLWRDPGMLITSVGIVGATLMPHNLYLHSSLAREPGGAGGDAARAKAALRRSRSDTVVSLGATMFLNVALVVLAARVFHGRADSVDIESAHRLLAPLLGSTAAPIVFALALLAAGQSATVTATLAGQAVMSGFMRIRWSGWARRLVTRALAIVPAVFIVARSAAHGGDATESLLVGSQVVLSLQLPFALVPLVVFTGDRRKMGALASPRWMTYAGWAGAALILAADALLVTSLGRG